VSRSVCSPPNSPASTKTWPPSQPPAAPCRTWAAAEFTADDPTVISSAYQQILAVLKTTTAGMRAKDICLALDIEPLPKHVEGARAKLKRLVNRELVTETQPGIFTLIPKRT
jgi:hypothetical protein